MCGCCWRCIQFIWYDNTHTHTHLRPNLLAVCVRAHKFKNKLLASVRLLSSFYLNYSEKKFSLSTYPYLCQSIQLIFNRWSKLVLFPANIWIKNKTTNWHVHLFVYSVINFSVFICHIFRFINFFSSHFHVYIVTFARYF